MDEVALVTFLLYKYLNLFGNMPLLGQNIIHKNVFLCTIYTKMSLTPFSLSTFVRGSPLQWC